MPDVKRSLVRGSFAVGVVLIGLAVTSPGPEAHKAITSKFTYTEHIYPILRDRCSKCHFEGGPTPMSLMTYRDALPWAESIREQLVGEKMPPWYADPRGPAIKGGHSISTKELDTLVTWAVGGTPEGELNAKLPVISAPADWKNGPPDLEVPMEKPHTLPVGALEEDREFTLATGLKEVRWVKAVDLRPETRSMVRDAVVTDESGVVLAAWVPGADATASPSGTAFKLPAGAKLRLKVHYKKHWQDEQNEKSDRTVIGLYFTDEPVSGKSIQSFSFQSADASEAQPAKAVDGQAAAGGADAHDARTFGGVLKSPARVLAIRPSFDAAYASVDIQAVLPAGRRVPLLRLRSAQPQWYQRYWLVEPIELPAGSKVEVAAVAATLDEFGVPVAKRYPLQVALDFVAP